MLRVFSILCFAVLLLCTGAAHAIDIDVEVSPQVADPSETFTFSVSVERRTPFSQEPQWASSAFFSLRLTGRSNQAQYINGEVSARTTFTYDLRPLTELTPGRYETPEGTITIDGKTLSIPKVNILIRKSSQKKKRSKGAQSVAFIQGVSNANPYIGEQITYFADVAADAQFVSGNLEDINYPGFWREELGSHSRSARKRGDLTIRSLREVLIPTTAGTFTIPKRKLLAELAVKSQRRRPSIFDRFAGFAPTRRTRRRQLFADAVEVTVRPLPPSPDVSQSYIPVGEVKIRTAIDKKTVVQGESVSMTVTLWGRANLRPFKLPKSQLEKGRDFKIYYDKPQSSVLPKNGYVLFSKTFRIAFVPQNFGKIRLPAFTFHSFDPESETYVSHSSDTFDIEVEKDPNFVRSVAPERPGPVAEKSDSPERDEFDPLKDGDLFPMQSIHAMRERPVSFSRGNLILGLSTLLAVICGLFGRREWRAYQSSQSRQKVAERALSVAQKSLKEADTDAAVVKDVLSTFLYERFDIRARSMTPGELEAACRHLPSEQREELLEISRQLECSLYAPDENAQLASEYRQRVLALLSALNSSEFGFSKHGEHE